MDTHTLELLEFDKIRALVAARAACSLGKEAALRHRAERRDPARSTTARRSRPRWSRRSARGLSPPFGGLHDIRPHVRRAQIGAMLEAEELAETVETLRAIGNLDRWLGRIGDQFPRLGGLRQGVGEFSGRGERHRGVPRQPGQGARHRQPPALGAPPRDRPGRGADPGDPAPDAPLARDQADPPLPQLHDGRPPLRPARSPRTTAARSRARSSGPAPATRRSTSSRPAIAEQSAQLSYLRAREAKEIRRILRWLSAQVGQVADSLLGTLETMAELDLIHARGRYSLDYRMSPPDFNHEGELVLRGARHPLLEAIFRKRSRRCGLGRLVPARGADRCRNPAEARRGRALRRAALARDPGRRPSPGPSCRSTSTSASSSRSWS